MTLFGQVAGVFNKAVMPLVDSPRFGGLVDRHLVTLAYTGRRSGREITVPVSYSLDGPDRLRVAVALPDQKTWWRNFLGDGAPVSLRLRGADRTGHAVSTRDDRGRVTVAVQLEPTGG